MSMEGTSEHATQTEMEAHKHPQAAGVAERPVRSSARRGKGKISRPWHEINPETMDWAAMERGQRLTR